MSYLWRVLLDHSDAESDETVWVQVEAPDRDEAKRRSLLYITDDSGPWIPREVLPGPAPKPERKEADA